MKKRALFQHSRTIEKYYLNQIKTLLLQESHVRAYYIKKLPSKNNFLKKVNNNKFNIYCEGLEIT